MQSVPETHYYLIIKIRPVHYELVLFICPAVTYSPIGVAPSVPSAWEGLTSVFGMGTGGTLPLSPPDYSVVKLKVLTFTLKIA